GARGACGGGAHAGWRYQPADHQVLGRLVVDAASAGIGAAARRTDHPSLDSDPAAHHGARVLSPVLHATPRRHAQRDHATPGAHADADAGGCGGRALAPWTWGPTRHASSAPIRARS